MEQNNKITLTDSELDQFSEIKNQLVEEIKGELATMGYEPIPQFYDGGRDIASLVDKAHKMKMTYEEECARIKARYSEEVANSKLSVLEQDFKYDMASLSEDIDAVVKKDAFFRQKAIEELQNTEQYKADRKEALETLALLKDVDVPYEIFGDIISPIVAAKDDKTLQIIKLLTNKNATNVYVTEKAIENVNAYRSNAELGDFAAAAKTFIVDNKDPFTLHAYMQLYTGGEK